MIGHPDAGGHGPTLPLAVRYRLEDELRAHRTWLREGRRPLERLTAREREVLQDLANGHLARDIADRSSVAISTVRSQIKSILGKLGVRSQIQAVAMATRSRWFASTDG